MQSVFWSILLLAFIIDVFRRSWLNNEKSFSENTDKNIINSDKTSIAGKKII